jgi:hypothetical protein
VSAGLDKLIAEQGKRWVSPADRVQRCLKLVRQFYPKYSEPVQLLVAKAVLETLERFDLEHAWDCVGEECRYKRAVLENNARRAGLGEISDE